MLALALALVAIGGSRYRWSGQPLRAEEASPLATERKLTLMLPMRDGVRLATDVWLPPGQGPWPVALERTVYGKPKEVDDAFARNGIARMEQDIRGTGASEGQWRFGEADAWGEQQDGAETVAWIRHQPWCNGKVATFGLPIPQHLLAGADLVAHHRDFEEPSRAQSKAVHIPQNHRGVLLGAQGLSGQTAGIAPLSLYHYAVYQNGVFRKTTENLLHRWRFDLLPLVRAHPSYDDFWRTTDLRTRLQYVRWPIVHSGGWFDVFSQGILDAFTELQVHGGPGARGRQYLTIGPWVHLSEKAGELTFPPNAKTPPGVQGELPWLRHWLKGEPTVPLDPPPVRYYVMGDLDDPKAPGNFWRAADHWPPPSRALRLYFTAAGKLTRERPQRASARDEYDYDPAHPVPTRGGQEAFVPGGSFDQRLVEDRPDVLLFTSDPLREPLEITGRIWVRLSAATSARDTDFTAKLCDVHPDGRSMLVTDGIVRARYRRSLEQPEPVTPGKRYSYDIDLWSTSLIFNRGHRIRVAISSSNAPRFEPNPNTWPDEKAEPRVARQTILLGGTDASYINLPQIVLGAPPRRGRSAATRGAGDRRGGRSPSGE